MDGPSPPAETQRLGIVVIGRNEGERLRACLASVCDGSRPVVYVDSNSTDGSPALARSFGAELVELDMTLPFSAGRARNAGFERLKRIAPNVEFVQFVDGDCEVVSTWLDAALRSFDGAPNVAVICGRRRERHPDRSIYNGLCDIEWDSDVGEAESCGGDAMFRAEAFAQVGGFDPGIVAGEEPELCIRLRAKGHRILRIAEEMTLHDAAIYRFAQWWKRSVRSGHAYAELAYLHGRTDGDVGARPTLSNLFWALGVPVGSAALLRFPRGPAAALAAYGWLAGRIYLAELRSGRTPEQAFRFAVFTTAGKFAETVGAGRFLFGVLTGKRSRIIEYKG